MRVADYIAQQLVSAGVDTCFMVTGGGAMHLNDAFGAAPGLRKVFCHHEQAAAMAAEGYARVSGRPALVNVTAGPGGINALNGVFGAFTDSIPMIVVSGQVKRETLMAVRGMTDLRQLGDQEVDIVSMARPITKWAQLVTDPADVPALISRAISESTGGRPGPVWLDIPIDVQGSELGNPPPHAVGATTADEELVGPRLIADVAALLDELARARRPVVMAGSGVRIAGATAEFLAAVELLGVPVVTAWTHDLIDSDHPLFAGRPGTIGTRAGNFVVQNADCVVVLGSRLNIRQVSYNWQSFARRARKICIDIDPAELRKPFVVPDLAIQAHLKPFLTTLHAQAAARGWSPRHDRWLAWCKNIAARYAPKPADYAVSTHAINAYHFMEALFKRLDRDDVVVCGDATATIVPFQIGHLKAGMRLFSNSGSASMGYDLPAALGAAVAAPHARIICLAGDGSVMMNIQELQTISGLGLNVKVFVLDNDGYLSIKQTQRNFFGRECGASSGSGLTFPDFEKVGAAFGLPSCALSMQHWQAELDDALRGPDPALINVPLDLVQEFAPRLKSRMVDGVIRTPELEDMFPFLPPEEIEAVRRSAEAID
jgi:acetolactate synthase-1/2/3 large subunit